MHVVYYVFFVDYALVRVVGFRQNTLFLVIINKSLSSADFPLKTELATRGLSN